MPGHDRGFRAVVTDDPSDRFAYPQAPARILETISPAGFEMAFREWASLLAAPGEPDIAAMDAVSDHPALEASWVRWTGSPT
jgi:hypothetical protein